MLSFNFVITKTLKKPTTNFNLTKSTIVLCILIGMLDGEIKPDHTLITVEATDILLIPEVIDHQDVILLDLTPDPLRDLHPVHPVDLLVDLEDVLLDHQDEETLDLLEDILEVQDESPDLQREILDRLVVLSLHEKLLDLQSVILDHQEKVRVIHEILDHPVGSTEIFLEVRENLPLRNHLEVRSLIPQLKLRQMMPL